MWLKGVMEATFSCTIYVERENFATPGFVPVQGKMVIKLSSLLPNLNLLHLNKRRQLWIILKLHLCYWDVEGELA